MVRRLRFEQCPQYFSLGLGLQALDSSRKSAPSLIFMPVARSSVAPLVRARGDFLASAMIDDEGTLVLLPSPPRPCRELYADCASDLRPNRSMAWSGRPPGSEAEFRLRRRVCAFFRSRCHRVKRDGKLAGLLRQLVGSAASSGC